MKLSEMKQEELKSLFDKSAWLKQEVYDYFTDGILSDYLATVPNCCFYQIGTYCQGDCFRLNGKRYLSTDEIDDIKEWLDYIQSAYGFLSDSEYEIVENWYSLAMKYLDVEEIDSGIEKQYQDTENELNRIIYNRLQSEYDQYLDDNYLFECFTDYLDSFGYIEIETDGSNYYRVEKSKIA